MFANRKPNLPVKALINTTAATGVLIAALFSSSASAHSIQLDCSQAGNTVECQGGFSDGSAASNLPWEVISYDDQLLHTGKTSEGSEFSFPAPGEDYYILMDAGPGHVVELDVADIAED